VDAFNRQFEAFEAAGLIKHWASFHMDMKFLNFQSSYGGPQQVSIRHLSGIFEIWLGGIAIALIAFAGEIARSSKRRRLNA
jgi:hypothetical protein